MNITLRSSLMVVTKTAETLGVSLPSGYTAELAKARNVVAGAQRFREVSAGQLNSAVLDAIEASRDVHTDETVQRMMFDRNLTVGGIDIAADQRGKEISHAALVDYADDILTSWAEFLAPHAEALAAAAEALPSHDLADAEQVATLTVQGMQHLSNAQIAVKLWAAAIQGFGVLVQTAGPRFNDHTRPLSITPDIGIPEFAAIRDEAARKRTTITPWLLAQHGIPVELATITGFAERIASYERQRETAQAELAERRRVAGFGAITAP